MLSLPWAMAGASVAVGIVVIVLLDRRFRRSVGVVLLTPK